MNALFSALPNEALAYMREHNIPKNLESLMWHIELLYGAADQDFTTRRQAVMALVREKDEPAKKFARRIMFKAVTATLRTETPDELVQWVFSSNINDIHIAPEMRRMH